MEIIRAVARSTDPSTSWAAARSIKEITQKQNAVLDALREYGPCTDEVLVRKYQASDREPQSVSGIRTRRKELVDRGLAEKTSIIVRGSTGRSMHLWRVKT